MRNFNLPALGAGVGLRHAHFEEILKSRPKCSWFEIISEDFVEMGGYVRDCFERILEHYTIIPHGVGLSIGSTDSLDFEYLKKLKDFLDHVKAPWYSDHLCFTMVDHINLEDLIPVPFTSEAVNHIAERVRIVQDLLERPFLLENVTRYITISDREMNEAEFISTLLEKANCGLLLDITNVYLNSQFHKFDAWNFISSIPLNRVGQIHLAGWNDQREEIIDSHDAPVPQAVWSLFKDTIALSGPTSVLIEWDSALPSFDRLLREAKMAEDLMKKVQPISKECVIPA